MSISSIFRVEEKAEKETGRSRSQAEPCVPPDSLISFLTYSSIMTMETCPSETWNSIETTRGHKTENRTLHFCRRENVKS
jgi:hypothetical protein